LVGVDRVLPTVDIENVRGHRTPPGNADRWRWRADAVYPFGRSSVGQLDRLARCLQRGGWF
jgi:hypothetical protein